MHDTPLAASQLGVQFKGGNGANLPFDIIEEKTREKFMSGSLI